MFRDRLELPIPDEKLGEAPYFHPGSGSQEVEYMIERRASLGGSVPRRVVRSAPLPGPAPRVDAEFAAGSATEVSTTMVLARLLRNLLRDPGIGKRIVPIIPDEARTFGMDPLFKEVGIYAAHGQHYSRWTRSCSFPTASRSTDRCWRRGSTRPGPWPRSRRPARRTPRTASR